MYTHVRLVHTIGQFYYTHLYTLSANVLLCVSEISSYTCTCVNTVKSILLIQLTGLVFSCILDYTLHVC